MPRIIAPSTLKNAYDRLTAKLKGPYFQTPEPPTHQEVLHATPGRLVKGRARRVARLAEHGSPGCSGHRRGGTALRAHAR